MEQAALINKLGYERSIQKFRPFAVVAKAWYSEPDRRGLLAVPTNLFSKSDLTEIFEKLKTMQIAWPAEPALFHRSDPHATRLPVQGSWRDSRRFLAQPFSPADSRTCQDKGA